MRFKTSLLAAAALLSMATAAQAVDFGGYFRTGPGSKGAGKCFDGGFAGGFYRLGNECNTYAEFELSQKGKMNDVDYKGLLMTNFYRPGSDIGDGSQNVHVNQLYLEAKGFDVARDQTFWVGRRFYGRDDVHMVDHFFVNMTGEGAGVEGIKLGGASAAVAVFRSSEYIFDGTGQANIVGPDQRGTRLNVDVKEIMTNPGGKLRVTGTLTDFKGDNAAGDDGKRGYGLSFQHNQEIGAMANTLWVQFKQGSADYTGGFGNASAGSGNKGWRVAESLALIKGPITYQTLAMIGSEGESGEKTKFASLGGRLGYAITNNFKLQGELGLTRKKQDGTDGQNLMKFTIAPTLTVGPNYYDRPELRLYYTHFKWNDAYRDNNANTNGNKSANSVGIQVEMWY